MVLDFEPREVFHFFEEICSIPHGSGNTRQISDYLVEFAKKHSLEYIQEPCGNVIIFKKASKGYEASETVILQGHMDMVCEKEEGANIDFYKDGLSLEVEEDEIFAKHTTLGGDDGIAVAYCLAILASETIEHPALEVVITVDEEIGMLGANALDCSVLQGKRLINIDSEDEGVLTVSCAGGLVGVIELPVDYVEVEGARYELLLEGLAGGHSGVEIDKERANANILMGRLLFEISKNMGFGIETISGGLKDNAIPRAARSVIWCEEEDEEIVCSLAAKMERELAGEFKGSEEGIRIKVNKMPKQQGVMFHPKNKEILMYVLRQLPNGVQKMSMEIPGLVETSCNLGILKTVGEQVVMEVSIRSSVESEKRALSEKIGYLTEFLGCDYSEKGDYVGWAYNPDSKLQKVMLDVYQRMYQKSAKIEAIHAGLECGILSAKLSGLECVSMGPDIRDIHTPQERLSISSTRRVWEYLLEVLKEL